MMRSSASRGGVSRTMLRISGVQRKRLPRWKDWDMVLPRCGNAAVVFGEDGGGPSPSRRGRGKDRRAERPAPRCRRATGDGTFRCEGHHSAKRHRGKAAGQGCDRRHARRVSNVVNGSVYGCSQRIERKAGTGSPAECHAVFPGRLQSRLAGRGGFPADMPAGRDWPAPGLLAGTGLDGIRSAGRAAGTLPAGGAA